MLASQLQPRVESDPEAEEGADEHDGDIIDHRLSPVRYASSTAFWP